MPMPTHLSCGPRGVSISQLGRGVDSQSGGVLKVAGICEDIPGRNQTSIRE
jgi:hypothetical protein